MIIDNTILEYIKVLPNPAIIAVSGFGASGKSTSANLLRAAINAPVIGIDAFVKDRTMIDYTMWNLMDFKRFEDEILIPFSQSRNLLHYGHFDWGQNKVIETIKVPHSGKIIIEGVGLYRPELLKYFTYKVWVDCPIEEAIRRGMKRDREVYQNPQDELWEGIWKKNDLECYDAYRPKEIADYVLDNGNPSN